MLDKIENITREELMAVPPPQRALMIAQLDTITAPENRTYERIAKNFDLPVGTVKSRIHRGRAKIIAMRAAAAEQNATKDAR